MSIRELAISGLGPDRPEIWHANEVPIEVRRRRHGHADLEVERNLSAAQHTTVSFVIEIGEEEVGPGGRVGIAWRWPFDWADLQDLDPRGPGYVTATVLPRTETGDGGTPRLVLDYQRLGGVEPWHHQLTLEVQGGPLRSGDRVRVTCGDRSGGGPGWRCPTCRLQACGFLVLVDASGRGRWTQLADLPPFEIAPAEAQRLIAVAGSEAVVGAGASLTVRAVDAWGNTGAAWTGPGELTVHTATGPCEAEVRAVNGEAERRSASAGAPTAGPAYAVHRFEVRYPQAGTYTLRVGSEWLGAVETNPVVVTEARPELSLYWGDLHAGQTEMGCGTGSVEDHFRYGRDVADVAFMSEQSNDHFVTAGDWAEIRRASDAMNEDGRFVAYLGCEWSPQTPAGGDRNVFYLRDEPRLQRSGRYFRELEPDPEPDLPTAPEFHGAFKHKEVLVNLHVGGRRSNLDYYEPAIERLAEIHSTHGTIEWFIEDVLSRGYRVGITAGTDGVMLRPAADHPGWRLLRNVPSGLTAVYARSLDREGLWEALSARRCYATTGPRMHIAFELDGHPMGEEYESRAAPTARIAVNGTTALERIDLLRGTTVIRSWTVAEPHPDGPTGERHVRVLWGGTGEKGTARRQRLDWDGRLTLEGGSILAVEPLRFDAPLDQVHLRGPDEVLWTSATAGGDAGLLLRIEPDTDARLHFTSALANVTCVVDDVRTPQLVHSSGFNRRVEIGPAPDPSGTRTVQLEHRDEEPADGWNPYWVRVIQTDRSRGWCSPVYLHRPGGPDRART